jgi:UDP-N-acetylglucosamine 2-epimerase (non-hydrolysing)
LLTLILLFFDWNNMGNKKLMFIFGTRPEAIKLAPLIKLAQKRKNEFECSVIVTAQHRSMLDDVLDAFDIKPDQDLNIMAPNQSLYYITSKIIADMERILREIDPDVIVVQGDTTTAMAGALSGFYAKKKIAHIEAGLRTEDKYSPYPEEINRKMTSTITDYHFAPTESSRENLLKEGYADSTIFITGNTVIDALLWTMEITNGGTCPVPELIPVLNKYSRFILITGHRRESFGEPMCNILAALKQLSFDYPDDAFIYPVHMNPNIQGPVYDILKDIPNFFLMSPLPYKPFCWLLNKCYFVITDSGGIQEEAPALGKPILVTRNTTERPEAVNQGMAKLVGSDKDSIIQNAQRLMNDHHFYKSMAKGYSPYGDGKAAKRILDILAAD